VTIGVSARSERAGEPLTTIGANPLALGDATLRVAPQHEGIIDNNTIALFLRSDP